LARHEIDGMCPVCVGREQIRALSPTADYPETSEEDGSFSDENPLFTPAVKMEPGDRIGRYELLEKIGEGGFGVVYRAEQKQPIKREVALKIIKLGMDTQQIVARFEAERQALAMMEHPNIARVFDGGATKTGRPYFVMELVKGVSITRYCDTAELTTKERLKLFITVCQAIQHAHQKGIIHRDIKPSNVMITLHDGAPEPKVIDFGIAKATQQELTEKTLYTRYSQIFGTPAYMSPEQAELSGLDVDTRTDVYSLGVLLYELLVGHPPLDAKELMNGGYDEIRRRIKDQEPLKPSTRLSTYDGPERISIAKQRNIGPNQLSSQLRGDLDWIVLKSLEKDRTRRYETASGFALDIGRFLNNEPVSAVAPSVLYKCRKFAQRNKLFFGAAAAIAVALVCGLSLVFLSYARERAAHAESESNRVKAVDALKLANLHSELSIIAKRRAEESEATTKSLLMSSRIQTYQADMNLASQAYHSGDIGRMNELVEKHRLEPGTQDLRGFEWYHWRQAGRLHIWEVTPGGAMRAIEISPDGSVVAASAAMNWIHVQKSGEERTLIKVNDIEITPFAMTPDSASLVVGCPLDGGLKVHDIATKTTQFYPDPACMKIRCLAFAPSGEVMASGGKSGHIVLWDTASWKPVGVKMPVRGDTWSLAFAPDGKRLLAAMEDSTVQVWDVTNPENPLIEGTLIGHREGVSAVAVCPGADFFATGSFDKTIRLWNMNGELIGVYDAGGPVTVLKFSRDDARLLAGTDETNSVLVWDVRLDPPALELSHTIKGHSRKVTGVGFPQDSNQVHSVSEDGRYAVWSLDRCEPYATLNAIPDAVRFGYTEDGKALWVSDKEGGIYHWDLQIREMKKSKPYPEGFRTLAFSEGGAVSAGISKSGFVSIRDIRTNEFQESAVRIEATDKIFRATSPIGATKAWMMNLSGDGSTVTWMTENGVHIWNPVKNRLQRLPSGKEYLPDYAGELHLPVLSFHGERLALSGTEQHYYSEAWDLAVEPPKQVWSDPIEGGGPVRCTAFSSDRSLLAIGSWDSSIRLFRTETGELRDTLNGHSKEVSALRFSRNGSRLASIGWDHKVCIWDVETGALLSVLQGRRSNATSVAWSPQGDSLAALSNDGTIKVWTSTARTPANIAAASSRSLQNPL
jgi:WD40 repeat protein/serine/threonine protein kinase